jgi:hypothetical protein
MLSGLAFGAVEVTIVSSRGALTNQVAFATNTFLSAEDSEFYKQTISVTPYDLLATIKAGTNDLDAVDFSCVTTTGKRATLVESSHSNSVAVSCEHWHHGVGDDMIFGAHTAKVIRVVLDPAYFPDGTPVIYEDGSQAYYDYCFMELDRKLPIEPAILAPVYWTSYFDLPFNIYGYDLPLIVINQDSNIRIGIAYMWGRPDGIGGSMKWGFGMRVGDSGSPVFIRPKGKLVLVGVMTMIKGFTGISNDLMPVERGWGL